MIRSLVWDKGDEVMNFHEWAYIKQHPTVWRILLGILVIPLAYAAILLASVWNPYGELHRLPMAVVDQDRATATMHWGRTVTRQLTRSKSLQFHRMTARQAHRELRAGKLYLVLIIPRKSSYQLGRLASHPETLRLTYQTDAGQSTVAAKMGSTAMQKLQGTLNQTVIQAEFVAIQRQTVQSGRRLVTTAGQLQRVVRASATGAPASVTSPLNEAIVQGLTRNGQRLAQQSKRPHQLQALAAPIKLVQHNVTSVANNGTGMAPYFMAISLFVGCITLNIIYDAGKRHGQYRNFALAWLDKMGMLWVFVMLAASAMWLAVLNINGLRPLQPGKTYLLSLLIVLAFFSLVTCFRLWLGLTGAWLMLIFMIFQIGCSGGTYPIALTNPLYRAVHPYLPMTIAMAGLRHTISLGGSIAGICWILASMVVVFSLGTLAYFYTHRNDEMLA
ncbi:hypothetical protein EFS30_07375 [Levilactobacillus parabrevis]|nr:hypothetical protein [Levilactobacillus parabrevis]MCT4490419.1 hypothetical protein [Levilactobacillus parabrevis]